MQPLLFKKMRDKKMYERNLARTSIRSSRK